jgi:hypothetical protein
VVSVNVLVSIMGMAGSFFTPFKANFVELLSLLPTTAVSSLSKAASGPSCQAVLVCSALLPSKMLGFCNPAL